MLSATDQAEQDPGAWSSKAGGILETKHPWRILETREGSVVSGWRTDIRGGDEGWGHGEGHDEELGF